jgi:transposase
MLNKINKLDSIIELEKAYAVTILELKAIQEENDTLKAKNLALEQEVALLKEQLLLARNNRFGSKSEANIGEDIIKSSDTTLIIPSHTRKKPSKRNGRIIDTSGLPRYKHYHDLDEAHKNCPQCNKLLTRIGEDVAEQLEIIPMVLYVVEHTRYKYACKPCNTIIMAPKPLSPIPKALAGGSLLSEVIVNKFQYHLPLYRQSKMFESINAIIPDNTLGNWVMLSGELLLPYIGEALWKAVLEVKYLQADETPIKLLKPNKKGYIWTYFALHQKLVVFEVAETRKGEIAENRLANFKGLLQTDAYSGYKNLRGRKGIVGFGCLSHARRKFADVLKITKNNTGIAAEFINMIKPGSGANINFNNNSLCTCMNYAAIPNKLLINLI